MVLVLVAIVTVGLVLCVLIISVVCLKRCVIIKLSHTQHPTPVSLPLSYARPIINQKMAMQKCCDLCLVLSLVVLVLQNPMHSSDQ